MVHRIGQPSIPLPSIFSQIASLLKNHYDGRRTDELHPALPPGTVKYGESFVRSARISIAGSDATCFINGRFDIVVEFDDRTYGVIDFKTGRPTSEYGGLYSRQLHAYAYALEHPAPGALALSPITKLGLLYFYPARTHQDGVEHLSYEADVTWLETPKNEEEFLEFIGGVLELLESPGPPEASPDCQWCSYAKRLSSLP
jgi:hypothetical protein